MALPLGAQEDITVTCGRSAQATVSLAHGHADAHEELDHGTSCRYLPVSGGRLHVLKGKEKSRPPRSVPEKHVVWKGSIVVPSPA